MQKRFFFGLSLLTQVAVAGQQLLLLPVLVRLWGDVLTASWYSALAIASIASLADLGLRAIEYPALRQLEANPNDPIAGQRFGSAWSWMRLLVLGATIALVSYSTIDAAVRQDWDSLWLVLLILAAAIELVIIVRIMHLDTVGRYVSSEAVYAGFAIVRLLASVVAVGFLDARPWELAIIFLASSILALAMQEALLRKQLHMLLTAPLRLRFTELASVRYTVAEPLANWVRLSLPIVVVSMVSTPAVVALMVALRAIFGLVRAVVQQIARVASVDYVAARDRDRARAAAVVVCFGIAGATIGGGVGLAAIIDNGRLLSLWLGPIDTSGLSVVAPAFALPAAFYTYQIFLSTYLRLGAVADVGRIQYAYIALAVGGAAATLFTAYLPVYLVAMVIGEIAIGLGFMWRFDLIEHTSAGRRSLVASGVWALLCGVSWIIVWSRPAGFVGLTAETIMLGLGMLVGFGLIGLAGLWWLNRSQLALLRRR